MFINTVGYTSSKISIAVLKYKGGDWYSSNGGVKNFLFELKKRTKLPVDTEIKIVELKSPELFNYPIIIIDGHHAEEEESPSDSESPVNDKILNSVSPPPAKSFKKRTILFDEVEKSILRTYLENGGFLFVNDDYGLYFSFMEAMKDVFPDKKVEQLSSQNKITKDLLSSYYSMTEIPKIHKHDGDAPEAYGIIINSRLSVLYLYSSDIADGWEPEGIYPDPKDIKDKSIQFGINMVYYIITH